VIDSGCSRHMTGNMSYLFDSKAIIDESKLWTPQQNGIAERKNRTLIEAARTMLADSLLPIPFWAEAVYTACYVQNRAEAVNTACYVQNRVLVNKPHNKTPYERLLGRTPSICFKRPFGCLVTILNTLDSLGKFNRKADEGFLVGYLAEAVNTACYVQNRVLVNKPHNKTPYERLLGRTPSICFKRPFGCLVTILNTLDSLGKFNRKADEGFLVGYLVSRSGPTWQFDIDTLTKSMNYQLAITGNQPNSSTGIQEHFDADKAEEGTVQQYVLFPLWSSGCKDPQNTNDDVNAASTPVLAVGKNSTNINNTFSAVSPSNTVVSPTLRKSSYVDPSQFPDDPNMPALEDITYSDYEEDVSAEADFSNLETTITISPIPTTRVHKDHPMKQIIGDLSSMTQTRSMTRMVKDQSGLTQINNEDFYTCMFACFLSQKEP
nr:ribonuclease H-like domain-containing protein [Tanacetum cinerariifolium]